MAHDPWDSRSSWIWLPNFDDSRNPGAVVLFRRDFWLNQVPDSCCLRVTADSRYRLFLNGHSISVGPCKGTVLHWNYETVEVASFLRRGQNVLAAQVLRYSPTYQGNTSISRSVNPGFILLAESDQWSLATDASWKCKEDVSVRFVGDSQFDFFLAINEHTNGQLRFFGWEQVGFDDSDWQNPIEIANESPVKEVSTLPWNLHPRAIPALTEIPKRFQKVVQVIASADQCPSATEASWNQLLQGQGTVAIPANSVVELDIQAGEYSTGYLEFDFSGGAGSVIRHLSAESYETTMRPPWPDANAIFKSDRRNCKTGFLNGEWDSYTVSNLIEKEIYEPFWFRTFRYIRIQVATKDTELLITHLGYRETNYPLNVRSYFQSSRHDFAKFWDVSLRTLKNCMHETYEDCPFYEQSQFCFDTRSQMLFTYNISGDDRLARKALHDFHTSLRPDGLISMRYPAHTNVTLPVFSLFFPLMVEDHIRYFADYDVATRYFPTCDSILNHFARLLQINGLVGQFNPSHWSYVDWVKDWVFATPPAAKVGPATYFSLVYALSLGTAAAIAEFIGRTDTSREYLKRKEAVIAAVNKECFDGVWYLDGPVDTFRNVPGSISQHCQVYAVLAGAISGEDARNLMARTLTTPTLHQASYSQMFYVFRALQNLGMYDVTRSLWEPFNTMLDQGLDTWAEALHNPRSDCHAWSAIPLYEFPCGILGIVPSSPGFESVEITPQLRWLEEAAGLLASCKGDIEVKWTSTEKDARYLIVRVPLGIRVTLVLPNGERRSFTDVEKIELDITI